MRGNRGNGDEVRVTKSSDIQYPLAFTPDARSILFRAFSSDTGWDLFMVPAAAAATPQRLWQTPANETEMSLSPDGRLLAYASDESGRTEIYVSRFPEMSNRVRVSSGGGQRPMWRGDGRELYFVSAGNRLMAASTGITGMPASPAALFEAPLFASLYAPARDGSRFLIAIPAPSTDIVPMEVRVNALNSR
jgi:Tol biopolymer transport system component